jgi:hypothetical protein
MWHEHPDDGPKEPSEWRGFFIAIVIVCTVVAMFVFALSR